MHSERKHGRFSPSQADRFTLCPGSVKLYEVAEPLVTDYQTQGTLAHEVLEAGLRAGARNSYEATQASRHAERDFTSDFRGAINDALDYVWSVFDGLNEVYGDAVILIEQAVAVPLTVAPGEGDGHVDVAIYSKSASVLYVIDYKHGIGVPKGAAGNRQVMQYALGLLNSVPDCADIEDIIAVIIQPRAFHPKGEIREWPVKRQDVLAYGPALEQAVSVCLSDIPVLVPGEEQCRFCDARDTCPAIERAIVETVNPSFVSVRDVTEQAVSSAANIPYDRLAYIMRSLKLLGIWKKAVEARAEQLVLEQGKNIPGLKMVETDSRRKYYEDEKVRSKKLAALIGCKETDLYRTEFKPITEVENMIVEAFKARVGRGRRNKAAEQARKLFAYFTIKEPTGTYAVALEDDPRPPANRALSLFSGVKETIPQLSNGENK